MQRINGENITIDDYKNIKNSEIIPDSTSSFKVKNQLYTDSYFLNNIEHLVDIYKKIIR